MNVEEIPIAELDLDPANVRQHDEKNLAAIKSSLKRFGQQKPIVVDPKGIVIAGNGTLTAARALGWDRIRIVRTQLEGSEATAYAIADNRTAELATWDDDALMQQLSALDLEDSALVEAAGFSAAELEGMVDGLLGEKEINEDEVPEVPEDPITKPGDLWILGDHRLLCGDSTKAEDVERLMGGGKVEILIADPPYGMNLNADYSGMRGLHQGKKHEAVHGDDKPFDASKVIGCDALDQFWFGADYYASSLADTEHTGAWLVWDKRLDDSADKMFGSCFELVWCSKKRKRDILRHKWAGIFTNGEARTFDHPTTKSVRLICDLITRADEGDIYDPFSGSGTTLIAAEQLGRRCFGMEISPQYCDVIVERWENLTGRKAELERRADDDQEKIQSQT
jgi:DNA modification methylase